MQRLARFIVDKRWFFAAIFVALIGYSIFGITRIRVEYDITKYLPANTDTAKAIEIMEKEFAASGTASLLVKDVSAAQANGLASSMGEVDGVTSVSFDSSDPANYSEGAALFSLFFCGDGNDARAVKAYGEVLDIVRASGKPYSAPTPLVNDYADRLASEMVIIIAIAAAVIIAVLLLTSKSYAEVLAFPVVFIVAAALNMGTNHWLGKISFVSNTVCIILQLALAIDYAIILCHRFTEEKEKGGVDANTALVNALAKAIPEISSSSLTTVSGLVALMFMQLRLGFDLGMVLAKSIIFSLLTVFFLMPCLLLLLSRLMDRSRHRSFVPKVNFLGAGAVKLRYVFIALFVGLFGVCAWLSQTISYCYSQNSIDTSRPTATMKAQAEAERIFGVTNAFVILVPSDVGQDTERQITQVVSAEPLITSALGWASVSLPSRSDPQKSYYLTDAVNYVELSDATGITALATMTVMSRHRTNCGGADGPLTDYRVPVVDIFEFVRNDAQLSALAGDAIDKYGGMLDFARAQLVGKNHDRILFNINSSVESKETFELIERLTPAVKAICPRAVFAGSSMSAYDLNKSFSHDNLLISLLTVAFIYIILAVTFRSWGIPVVLALVIQGAIFINFSLPVIMGNNMFFFVYLIACAIQMGATIDYAILLTNRFFALEREHGAKQAAIEAVSAAFPTVITSGAIMTVAALLVGFMTSNPLIASMGMTLGTGTVISIVCVLTVLPALLYVLCPLLKKTVVDLKRKRTPDAVIPSGDNDENTPDEKIPSGDNGENTPDVKMSGGGEK